MDVSVDFLIWEPAVASSAGGTFVNELIDFQTGETADWLIEQPFSEGFRWIVALREACDAIFPECGQENRHALRGSFERIFVGTMHQWNELPGSLDTENFWLALSPETINQFAVFLETVNYDELASKYDEHCPADAEYTLDYGSEGFVEHLQQWANLIQDAERQKLGLLARIG